MQSRRMRLPLAALIALAGVAVTPAAALGSREGFTRIFLVAAGCMSISLLCVLVLKEKPLHTDVTASAG